jgi:hypothetical protein
MKVDLRTVKIYLISPGTGKYEARQATVLERLKKLGCTNVEVVKSVEDSSGTNSLTRTNIEIFKKEMNSIEPFFILEDDCQFVYDQHIFEVPDSTDAVYFGVSRWVYPHSYESLWQRHVQQFHIRENQVGDHTLDGSLVRIRGMTSTHAILFCSNMLIRAFLECAEELLRWQTPHDLIFATLQRQPQFQVYALPSPMIYQDSTLGGQESQTKLRYKDGRYIA